jgi:hypothetical protein
MAMTPDGRNLVLTLYNGVNYQEIGDNPQAPAKPFQRTYFEEQMRKFDLSSFDLAADRRGAFQEQLPDDEPQPADLF